MFDLEIKAKCSGVLVSILFLFFGGAVFGQTQSSGQEKEEKAETLVKVYRGAIKKDRERDEKRRIGLGRNPKVEQAYRRSHNYREFHRRLKKAGAEEKVLRAFANEMYQYEP